jgi:hypothetical protein
MAKRKNGIAYHIKKEKPYIQIKRLKINGKKVRPYNNKTIVIRNYNINKRNKNMSDKQRQIASTPEGYFKQTLGNIKHGKRKETNELTVDFLCELFKKQNGRCALSGIKMDLGDKRNGPWGNPFMCSIDRINNNVGYTKDNVWLILSSINAFKGKHSIPILLNIVKKIYEYNNLGQK